MSAKRAVSFRRRLRLKNLKRQHIHDQILRVRMDLGFFMLSIGRFAMSVAGFVIGGLACFAGFAGKLFEAGIFVVFMFCPS